MDTPLTDKLVYINPKNQKNIQSKTLREKEQALSELVENVRILSVKSESDALTIDVELLSNIEYFMKIMKLVDEEFLMREYKITKESNILGSLIYSVDEKEAVKNRSYFHVYDSQKHVY